MIKVEIIGADKVTARLKHCSSLPDLIGRHLLVEWCGREDLAHVPLPGDAGRGVLPKTEGRFTQHEGS